MHQSKANRKRECPLNHLSLSFKCVSSSIGRVLVSKTKGRRFDPYLACKKGPVVQWIRMEHYGCFDPGSSPGGISNK